MVNGAVVGGLVREETPTSNKKKKEKQQMKNWNVNHLIYHKHQLHDFCTFP